VIKFNYKIGALLLEVTKTETHLYFLLQLLITHFCQHVVIVSAASKGHLYLF